MALLDLNKTWVGVQRRATDRLGHRDAWYPTSYVTLSLPGHETVNISPSNAKALAKAITAAANLIEPPVRRAKT